MATTDPHSPAPNALFRFVAVAVLFLSITASGLQVMGGISEMQHADTSAPVPVPAVFIPAILTLIAGIALATLLEGIARLVGLQPAPQQDNTDLQATIAELQQTLPTLIGQAVQQAVAEIPTAEEAPAQLALDPGLQQHLERMVKLLEEMKELSMLDDSQRQNKRRNIALRRKASRLEEAGGLIQQGNWAEADALLHLLESLHPDDAEVLACRNQLDESRILHQANEWEQLTGQVTDLLARSDYPQALDSTNQFLERYPTHSEAQQLVQRIGQEQRSYIESTSSRLYDEIKAAVEGRQWRTALDGIQRFLERFGDHPRAEKIRKQLRTIQKNAEIEERHEQEDRIKELISARRFGEAADLSEIVLGRFPDSPQAAYLTDLVPKLREKSTEAAEITQ